MKKYSIPLVVILFCQPIFASQEGILSISSFRLESKGIGSSGNVVVTGKKDDSGVLVELKVKAFSKEINVPKKTLAKISTKYQNGIQISYEAGYKKLGGRTVYILFQKGYTSSVKEKAVLAVKEDGSSKILTP